jgi:hypothetical protein
VWIGQAVAAAASHLKEKSKARAEETALKKARKQLVAGSKGSAGRQSAEEQRDRVAKELVKSGAVRSNSGTVDGRIQDMVQRGKAERKNK